MEARFQLTKDDYYHYRKYRWRHKSQFQPWMVFVVAVLVVLTSPFTVSLIRSASFREPVLPIDHRTRLLLFIVILPFLFFIFYSFVITKILLKSQAEAISGFLDPQTVRIAPGNISQKTSVAEAVFPWSSVEAIEDDESFIYFFLNRRFACLIPKRAFATPELAANFCDVSRAYWQGISPPVTGSETWPPSPRLPR